MSTCSRKNIEENSRRTDAGCHPECEPTYIDAQSALLLNLRPEKPSCWIERITFGHSGVRWRFPVDPTGNCPNLHCWTSSDHPLRKAVGTRRIYRILIIEVGQPRPSSENDHGPAQRRSGVSQRYGSLTIAFLSGPFNFRLLHIIGRVEMWRGGFR